VDLSGIIFVALAVAWAVYLIPKALRHHDEVARSRSVDRFSNTMRVLARREPVGTSASRLVMQPGRGHTPASVTVKGSAGRPASTRQQLAVRREAARVATARRRRVLGVITLLNVVVAAVAAAGVIGWAWMSAPGGLMVVWLIACRLMVKQEIAAGSMLLAAPVVAESVDEDVPESYDVARNEQGFDEVADDAETATFAVVDAELWDPVPVTLPTYVTKPAAVRRSVRTINLGDEDVWTSGRTEESASIAREAEAEPAAVVVDDDRRIVNG
jgi:hypothetical protein